MAQVLGCDEATGRYTGPYKSWKDRVLDDSACSRLPTLNFRPLGLSAWQRTGWGLVEMAKRTEDFTDAKQSDGVAVPPPFGG